MPEIACAPAQEKISDVTLHRLKLEGIAQSLYQLSQTAGYYALQTKNDHSTMLEEGLPEMRVLLLNVEQQLRGL
jgi:hypothetical protein